MTKKYHSDEADVVEQNLELINVIFNDIKKNSGSDSR